MKSAASLSTLKVPRKMLRELEAQLDEVRNGGGSYGGDDDISVEELMERIEQVREAIQMHEERGESEHVEGATQVLRELEAQLDEVRNGGGSYGGDDDISVEELMERIEQVREAIQMHEERGESEHVEGATQVLRELEAQLDEVRNGGGSYGGDDDISVEELMERIEQVREAIQMHEERGESEHVEGATQVLRELEAQLDEVRNGGGSYGGDDDISVEELMERIEQVREAIQMHEERGESEHVEGATQVLRELEAQLDEVRNGGGSYGGDDDISVEELMERIEQVREAIQMHEERGESEHVEGATQVLRELEAELSEKQDVVNIDVDGMSVEDIRDRVELLKVAVRDHEEAGEDDHALQASRILRAYQRALAREEGVVDSSYPSGKQQKSRPSTGGRGSGDRSGQANAGSNANDASRSLEDLSRDELAEVIRQTHGAYQRHVEAGEDEHVEGAGLSLLSLRSQLSRLSGVYEVGSDGTLSFAAGMYVVGFRDGWGRGSRSTA